MPHRQGVDAAGRRCPRRPRRRACGRGARCRTPRRPGRSSRDSTSAQARWKRPAALTPIGGAPRTAQARAPAPGRQQPRLADRGAVAEDVGKAERRRRLIHVGEHLAEEGLVLPPATRPSRACATKFRNGTGSGNASARAGEEASISCSIGSSTWCGRRSGGGCSGAAASARVRASRARKSPDDRRGADVEPVTGADRTAPSNWSATSPSAGSRSSSSTDKRRLAADHLHRLGEAFPEEQRVRRMSWRLTTHCSAAR